MSYVILYTALGLTALILISAALWNCLSTPRYNSIGEYLRKEGIPPRPKELRFKRPLLRVFKLIDREGYIKSCQCGGHLLYNCLTEEDTFEGYINRQGGLSCKEGIYNLITPCQFRFFEEKVDAKPKP